MARSDKALGSARGLRWFAGLFSVVLIALCLLELSAAHHGLARAGSARAKTFDLFFLAAISEMLIAFTAFSCLTLIWALAQPAWVERAFIFVVKHLWHAMVVFVLVTVITVFIV